MTRTGGLRVTTGEACEVYKGEPGARAFGRESAALNIALSAGARGEAVTVGEGGTSRFAFFQTLHYLNLLFWPLVFPSAL